MAIREIRLLGDPVLRRETEPVETFDDELQSLIDDMFETMYDAEGVGLAAPQIGLGRRLTVIDIRDPEVPPFALINPKLEEASEETARGEEGCLSVPGLQEIVERPARVVVEGLDREGEPQRFDADGLLARALQHEIDHLDGVLFIDRVSALKRRMLLKKWKKVRPAASER